MIFTLSKAQVVVLAEAMVAVLGVYHQLLLLSQLFCLLFILLERWVDKMFFDKGLYNKNLKSFYLEHYGEKETDIWYEQPAVNVWVFGRDDKIITLKSDVRTGIIEEFVEYIAR